MSDRELLEKAAKAVGIELEGVFEEGTDAGRAVRLNGSWWDPLNDDGDALRLAVQKRFWVKDFSPTEVAGLCSVAPDGKAIGMVEIWREIDDDPIHVEYYKQGDDRFAATRRAIVRAAASLGEKM